MAVDFGKDRFADDMNVIEFERDCDRWICWKKKKECVNLEKRNWNFC